MNEEISATGRDEEERDKETLRGEGWECLLPLIPSPGTLHFFRQPEASYRAKSSMAVKDRLVNLLLVQTKAFE